MRFSETRPFGIEIEYIGGTVTATALATALNNHGIPCHVAGYTHFTTVDWKIVSDSTVRGRNPGELVSPKLYGLAGLAQVKQVMQIMRNLGCSINSTCGMHVHHDASHLNRRQKLMVAQAYERFFPAFKGIFSPSRMIGQWASNVDDQEYVRMDVITRRNGEQNPTLGNRYHAVNLQALLRHGTIEFRQHQGTLNGSKATAWIVFTQNIMTGVMHVQRFSNRRLGDTSQLRRGLNVLLVLRRRCPHYGTDEVSAKALRHVATRNGWRIGKILSEHGFGHI